MALWLDVMRTATVLNIGLLVVLAFIWARNYLSIRSKHTLGLLIFAVFMLAHNALAIYFSTIHADLSRWYADVSELPQFAMMVLSVLQLGALVFLTWVTWE